MIRVDVDEIERAISEASSSFRASLSDDLRSSTESGKQLLAFHHDVIPVIERVFSRALDGLVCHEERIVVVWKISPCIDAEELAAFPCSKKDLREIAAENTNLDAIAEE